MEIVAFVYPDWNPRIRPASSRREWMDATPESFAYRCLPLATANAHGWEILSPCGFEAVWDGGTGAECVTITADHGTLPHEAPVSLFGQGTVTVHIAALFRTPPGWNLWIGGSPNHAKDGIAPLGGIIETDWSPYSFTMNWRFTRANHLVRFEQNEPIAFFFPVARSGLERFEARIAPIDEAPDLKARFETWSRSRDAFHRDVAVNPPASPSDKWQKLYYRGVNPDGSPAPDGHQIKLRVCPFAGRPERTPD